MPTDTQREPTAEEVQLVGHELVEEVELSAPIGASDRIIIAIAKRVREARAEQLTRCADRLQATLDEYRESETNIYADIAAERMRQDAQWGGPGHDDTHTTSDWRRFRAKFEERVSESAFWGDADSTTNFPAARDALVKIAALAVAEIEWLDRITAQEAPHA